MKIQKNNKNTTTLRLSIDELHKKKYNEINNKSTKIEELNNLIKQKQDELGLLKKTTLNPFGIPKMRIEIKIWQLEEQILNLQKQIKNIDNDEIKYILKSGKFLKSYYNNLKMQNQPKNNDNQNTTLVNNSSNICFESKKTMAVKSLFDKIKGNNTNETYKETNNNSSNTNNTSTNDNKLVNNNKNNTKQNISINKLYSKYMKIIDNNYIENEKFNIMNSCSNCNQDMTLNHNNGIFNCNNCGLCKNFIIDTDKQNHKDPPKEMTTFSYKRINHLNEILAQMQGKETTDIPPQIYEKIYTELRKEKFTDISKLTVNKLKKILKKIKLNKYYEHIPYMVIQMGGVPPPIISPQVEDIIRDFFLRAQHPFSDCHDKDRNNFLTYAGVLYKLFELLDLDDYLKNFKFLKDDKKQYTQEKIWKSICKALNWEFISSS